MGYATFKSASKNITTGDQIGPGQVTLSHLDPALYQEIRSVQLHNHSGAKSRRVNLKDVEGAFGTGGFYMYNTAGVRYHVTIDGAGALAITAG